MNEKYSENLDLMNCMNEQVRDTGSCEPLVLIRA